MPKATWTGWRKAQASTAANNCVEVRAEGGVIQVRNSKVPDGPVATFTLEEWEAFLDGARKGEFNISA